MIPQNTEDMEILGYYKGIINKLKSLFVSQSFCWTQGGGHYWKVYHIKTIQWIHRYWSFIVKPMPILIASFNATWKNLSFSGSSKHNLNEISDDLLEKYSHWLWWYQCQDSYTNSWIYSKPLSIHLFKDSSMMYPLLWDRRHNGAIRISQCMRFVAPSALT